MENAIVIPEALISVLTLIVGGFVILHVTNGIKSLGKLLGVNIEKFAALAAATISATVVTLLVASINTGLSFIPAEYAGVVNGLFSALLSLLAGMGLYSGKGKEQPKE